MKDRQTTKSVPAEKHSPLNIKALYRSFFSVRIGSVRFGSNRKDRQTTKTVPAKEQSPLNIRALYLSFGSVRFDSDRIGSVQVPVRFPVRVRKRLRRISDVGHMVDFFHVALVTEPTEPNHMKVEITKPHRTEPCCF